MDVVGSEIGQKMRSAIKAKLTELGCYVDDELPDYVMVMVANKRTRSQMEDDLQLFLGENTELFVNWLHQVLKKLQEVTVTTPLKSSEKPTRVKDKKASKDKKEKKDKSRGKHKKSDAKKIKKRNKTKNVKKQEKSSKKSSVDSIRAHIPPLTMNLEKDAEPSITDVFAGQILKNHGDLIEKRPETSSADVKLVEIPKTTFLVIDPATITSELPESLATTTQSSNIENDAQRDEQIKEINVIEAKIQGLKQKLADQLDSMSDDEDFLNIRTEAEELMNDFADDVLQEISNAKPPGMGTPEITKSSQIKNKSPIKTAAVVEDVLPQIELKLPKRPLREPITVAKVTASLKKKSLSPERLTPERVSPKPKLPVKSRLGLNKEPEPEENSSKQRSRAAPASVVRVRPRPRPTTGAPASNLLLRAVADAQKSLLKMPQKTEQEPHKIQRALVLPMRRSVENTTIVIQVPTDRIPSAPPSQDTSDCEIDFDTESLPDSDEVKTTNNIHNAKNTKEKGPQFVVTLDGLDPNIFLAKKLKTEGLIAESEDINSFKQRKSPEVPKLLQNNLIEKKIDKTVPSPVVDEKTSLTKRLSDASEESDIQVIITSDAKKTVDKPKVVNKLKVVEPVDLPKKRKASPIVFDVDKDKRTRKESGSSDTNVSTTSKYDSVPSLSSSERKPLACREFPSCRWGAACLFQHPPCRFAAACSRRACVYSHPPAHTAIASHVVPAANYKTITTAVLPGICKYYPNCSNPACHFFHPKPCRFGKACVNKLECNFYHHDLPTTNKWSPFKV